MSRELHDAANAAACADPAERKLLARAAATQEFTALRELKAETLRAIAARDGIDFATALLFDRVTRSEPHASFIARVDQAHGTIPADFARSVVIAIVPAPFYREMPHSGADGRVIREVAAEAGIACELVPVRSAGTLAENAAILREWLRARAGRRIVLVSLCKGGADVKFALAQPHSTGDFAEVAAWINICGTLRGSHVARWSMATRSRLLATWIYCRCKGAGTQFLRELAPTVTGPLAAPLRLPATLRLFSIVGFPLRVHLTNAYMRRCHAIIAPAGPNDGGVLLADVSELPGPIYPVWGADHYLRPDARARRILAGVLGYLAGELPAVYAAPTAGASAGR